MIESIEGKRGMPRLPSLDSIMTDASTEVVGAPVGRPETVKVVMYPDLNDWISLGSVLTRLAKPFIPKYRMWFEAEAPHRLVRIEGPYGPPGAPEIILELAAVA